MNVPSPIIEPTSPSSLKRWHRKALSLADLARHHSPHIIRLWIAASSVSLGNFVTSVVIVASTDADTYARYTLGLSLVLLATAWSDAGLASAIAAIAADKNDTESKTLACVRFFGKTGLWIESCGYIAAVLVGFLVPGKTIQSPFQLFASFALVGIINARASAYNAVLLGRGRFGSLTIAQAVPQWLRIVGVCLLAAVGGRLTMPILFVLTLLPSLATMVLSRSSVRALCQASSASGGVATQDRELRKYFAASAFAVLVGAVTYNITVIVSARYAALLQIAAYGIFQRLTQPLAMLGGPINNYILKYLRGYAGDNRVGAERMAFVAAIGIYATGAAVLLLAYVIAGRYVVHYSLQYRSEFVLFVVATGLGYFSNVVDAMLTSRAAPRHRSVGGGLTCVTNVALLILIKPHTLIEMVVIDVISLIPMCGSYALYYASAMSRSAGEVQAG